MRRKFSRHLIVAAWGGVSALGLFAAVASAESDPNLAKPPADQLGVNPRLPEPFSSNSVENHPRVIGWPKDRMPTPAAGLKVMPFARDLDNPRMAYVLPDQSVLVCESNTRASANRVRRLVDKDHDGKADAQETFVDGLNRPFGMLFAGGYIYIANTDAVLRWPYQTGQASLKGKGEKILELPAEGYNNHWTRNLIASPDHKHLFVTVGSASNVDEKLDQDAKEPRRAAILRFNPDGSGAQIYGSGLRNPVGMGIEPKTGTLWTVVNERDELGDDLCPDYLTHVEEGKFYGWPYAYWGQHEDPRHKGKRPDLVAKSTTPDFALGAHTASLGLCFNQGSALGADYDGGAFIGQHGSWNRSEMSGYRVLYLPFKDGKPGGQPRDVLSGFVADAKSKTAFGRPVGVAIAADGALLVCDDAGGIVWRVYR